MTNEQEEQLIIILSDFIPIMDGDRVQGVLPNAKDLTRQKVLEQLEEEQSQLPEGDPALLEWEEENIELLKMITDEEFQAVLTEKILLTEIQIGQSIFQPLTTQQLSVLAEKLQGQKEKSVENSDKQSSIFKNIFSWLR
ncbi:MULTISPECIES: hypothetical protein [Streptococcus mitis group]|jgi:hypothetical protein|uniref:Uncharacterized protein n=2 Tax=Streptococcus mitis group TaxID=3409772 RepID=A0A387AY99_9STRE|nr:MULTISPECIES: hypothetical protein [Streptococcus]AYF95037.1 hypothetical protein D7D53_00380 [Streptococcus gwangjuense]KEQ34386.1 hypothetical protein SK1126_0094 [Streptococcus mitis]MDB0074267.1 hypothetical protein [Streptococcus gwangjuense]MDB0074417.1 hypothetical protein [Streptococcus gwangjuense]MDB0075204.1 hypothetical protein [Streptococcus gwangjuense]